MPYSETKRQWFVTWTTYGTWLPGDDRGFVSPIFARETAEPRNHRVGTPYDADVPALERRAEHLMVGPPVWLSSAHASPLRGQLQETACFRRWLILAGAILSNHVHLLVEVEGDPDPSRLLRDFKSYGSRALNERFGRPPGAHWWTEQGSTRKIRDENHFRNVRSHILEQDRPLSVWTPADDEDGFGVDRGLTPPARQGKS